MALVIAGKPILLGLPLVPVFLFMLACGLIEIL